MVQATSPTHFALKTWVNEQMEILSRSLGQSTSHVLMREKEIRSQHLFFLYCSKGQSEKVCLTFTQGKARAVDSPRNRIAYFASQRALKVPESHSQDGGRPRTLIGTRALGGARGGEKLALR